MWIARVDIKETSVQWETQGIQWDSQWIPWAIAKHWARTSWIKGFNQRANSEHQHGFQYHRKLQVNVASIWDRDRLIDRRAQKRGGYSSELERLAVDEKCIAHRLLQDVEGFEDQNG